MKRILFVSFFAPPMGSGGARRVLKIVNNLSGFKKYLLTADYPSIRYRDNSSKISSDTEVFRVYYKDPRIFFPKFLFKFLKIRGRESKDIVDRYRVLSKGSLYKLKLSLFIPDEKITWVKDATKTGKSIIRREGIDVVFTSGPPHSVHLVGLNLKKMGVKWVMDMRDLWSDNPFVLYPKRIRRKNMVIEERCIKNADLVITATESFKNRLLSKYGFLSREKVKVVYGGYDDGDFNVKPKELPKFSISYVGSFYSIQTPIYFLKAVRELIDEDERIRKNIKVYIIGPFEENTKKIVSELKLYDFVSVTGFLPHREAISFMLGSSLLFLYLAKEGFETVPQKTFEYMRCKKRILALIPEGECKRILHSCGFKDSVPPDNIDAIKRKIRELFSLLEEGKEFKPDMDCIKRYSMENIVEDFKNSLKEGGIL